MTYRDDITGLRAIAILFVVLFHFQVPGFTVGFVGVDIFFAISGFLMAEIIQRGLKNGSFSVAGFYWSRFLRIYPPVMILLLAGLWCGYFFLAPEEYRTLATHSLAALGSVANVAFYRETFDYFAPAQQTNWLLHLWSLSVEGQFYLLFPPLLALSYRVRTHLRLQHILLGTFAASFAACVAITFTDRPAAFYLLQTRVWEFLAGSLAYVSVASGRPAWHPGVALLGTGLILVAPLALNARLAFPGYAALLPVLGAALVLAAPSRIRILTNPVSQYIGKISYSLYLWHWPVWVAAAGYGIDGSLGMSMALLALSVGLATVSYYAIERPCQKWRGRLSRPPAVVGVLAVGLASAGLAGFVVVWAGLPDRTPAPIRDTMRNYPNIASVRAGTCFLSPPAGPEAFASACFDPPTSASSGGVFLWGDSHAAHLWSGFANAPAFQSTRLFQATAGSCPPFIDPPTELYPRCDEIDRRALDEIRRLRPDAVVLAARWIYYNENGTDVIGKLHRLIDLLTGLKIRVIVVGPIPEWPPSLPQRLFKESFLRGGSIPDRLHDPSHAAGKALDRRMAVALAATGAEYISLFDLLCNADGCKTVAEDGPRKELMAWDYSHLTISGAEWIVAHAIVPAVVGGAIVSPCCTDRPVDAESGIGVGISKTP
jgi:peptidoglycan/LPS O-acetylase OafA/YrhL